MPKQKKNLVLKKAGRAQSRLRLEHPVGRPRKYDELKLKYLKYTDIAERLWLNDYRPLVADAIDAHPTLAGTLTPYLSSAPGHYKRLLASQPDTSALQAYQRKVDTRLAELLEEIDGIASQKCRSVLKEARGIAFKIQGISMSQVKSASYSGANPIPLP